MRNIAFIFARGGSKGLPDKNIKSFNGKPLIAHSIDLASRIQLIDQVLVSTDDEEIAKVASDYGAQVPFMRPKELAEDNSPEWLAWQHACEYVFSNQGPFNKFISLPTTAPLRTIDDVNKAITYYQENTFDTVITSVEAKFNPYFTLIQRKIDGSIELFGQDKKVIRRQDAPKALGIVPVAYISSPKFIMENSSIWDGGIGTVQVNPLSSIDIDDANDFYMAELIAKDQQA